VELSCKDYKCDPCTYPNCQRYKRGELIEGADKKNFKIKTVELKKTDDLDKVFGGSEE